jgi:hypothetical protein
MNTLEAQVHVSSRLAVGLGSFWWYMLEHRRDLVSIISIGLFVVIVLNLHIFT